MKKLLSTITVFALILMIPALFIGYLYNNTISGHSSSAYRKSKTEQVNTNQETSFTPVASFIFKG